MVCAMNSRSTQNLNQDESFVNSQLPGLPLKVLTNNMTSGQLRLMVRKLESLLGNPPAPVEAGRRQRRREETIGKLFIAAMDLFARKGFTQTTVEEITRTADVGKGTFFNYFPSKEHILGYFVSQQHGTIQRHLLLAREQSTTSEELLTSLARDLIKVPGKSPQMARSLIAAFLGNKEVREYIVREMLVGRKMVAEIISLGQTRGEFREELAPLEMARVFQHVLLGAVLLWAVDPVSSLKKQFGNTIRIFFSGLNASSKSPRPAPRKVLSTAAKRGREVG
jgi:AcrR family transcriptional regulator